MNALAWYLLGAFTLGIILWNVRARRATINLIVWTLRKFEALLNKTDGKKEED